MSDNRDRVLLGLLLAMGGRLSCSSEHDITASMEAVRCMGPTPSAPPRLLDSHTCRPPSLLEAATTASVGLYEVRRLAQLAGSKLWLVAFFFLEG